MNSKRFDVVAEAVFWKLVILAALFLLPGCQTGHSSRAFGNGEPDQQALVEAYHAFWQGDFKAAEKWFHGLHQNARDPDLRRIGLYGVACTRLMMAENGEELTQAYALWQAWNQIPAPQPNGENPRMLGPILEKSLSAKWGMNGTGVKGLADQPIRYPLGSDGIDHYNAATSKVNPETAPPQTGAAREVPHASSATPGESGQAKELMGLLQSREKENLKLKRQLKRMEQEMSALKNQLHAIEEIHQEILEKKKGMQLP